MSETTVAILERLSDVLGVKESELRNNAKLADLKHWDSVNALRVLSRIEKDFGIRLDLRKYMASVYVSDITDLVLEANDNG